MPLVHAKAQRVERPVKRITVRDSRSRWGSCGPDATMSFSWRLVFAPPEVLDYLVAHEVAHLVHLNHGPRFWALARTLCDGPIEGPQAWLKKNGEILLQYGASRSGRPYSAAARAGATFSTAAASLATSVPSKKRGFCVPHSRTALAKVKSRKSSAVMSSSSTSS